MGLTLTEKILKAHLVDGEYVKGQEIGIRIDPDSYSGRYRYYGLSRIRGYRSTSC